MPATNPNPLLVGSLFGIHGRVAVITGGGTGLGESFVSDSLFFISVLLGA
jgi:hypothetical protein